MNVKTVSRFRVLEKGLRVKKSPVIMMRKKRASKKRAKINLSQKHKKSLMYQVI